MALIFDRGSDFQKDAGTRIETILGVVLKFQADHACFHAGEASGKCDKKVECQERRKKDTIEHASRVTEFTQRGRTKTMTKGIPKTVRESVESVRWVGIERLLRWCLFYRVFKCMRI